MRKFQFFAIFLLALSLNLSLAHPSEEVEEEDVTIDCTYSTLLTLYINEYEFTCTLRNNPQIISYETVIKNITTITTGKGSEKVTIFYASGKTIRYFPRNLQELFPLLTGVRLDNTQLEYITKEDLESYTNLEYFVSYLNLIEFLPKDLFKFNTKLRFVNFRLNKIKYIDANIFDGVLGSLEQLWLDGTVLACGFRGASSNSNCKKQVDLLKKSECAKIKNAPPLYTFWLKIQEEQSGGDECEAKLAQARDECDEAMDEYGQMYECREPCLPALSSSNPFVIRRLAKQNSAK